MLGISEKLTLSIVISVPIFIYLLSCIIQIFSITSDFIYSDFYAIHILTKYTHLGNLRLRVSQTWKNFRILKLAFIKWSQNSNPIPYVFRTSFGVCLIRIFRTVLYKVSPALTYLGSYNSERGIGGGRN